MVVLLIVAAAVLVLVIQWIIAKEFAKVATDKGYAERKYFWYCFLFSVVGYMLVMALPSKEKTKKNNKNDFQLPNI